MYVARLIHRATKTATHSGVILQNLGAKVVDPALHSDHVLNVFSFPVSISLKTLAYHFLPAVFAIM